MALGLPGGCLAPFGPTRKTNAPNMRRVAARIQKTPHLDLGPGPPVNHPAQICTHSHRHIHTHGHIHTLAEIQQQSIYIYTKCTNLVIVRLTQWDEKADEGKGEGFEEERECMRERSGGAAALNMGDVRRHAKVVCVGERTKVGNVIFSRGAGATTCLHTCWNVCMHVCE